MLHARVRLQVIVSGQRFVPNKLCATQSDAKNYAADYVLLQLGASYPGIAADPSGESYLILKIYRKYRIHSSFCIIMLHCWLWMLCGRWWIRASVLLRFRLSRFKNSFCCAFVDLHVLKYRTSLAWIRVHQLFWALFPCSVFFFLFINIVKLKYTHGKISGIWFQHNA